MLPQCPLPVGSPSRDMTRSPLLAGCKHSQHSPGHQTGVWELCWEARTSLAVSELPRLWMDLAARKATGWWGRGRE